MIERSGRDKGEKDAKLALVSWCISRHDIFFIFLHKPLFKKNENIPEECVNRDILYPKKAYFWHLNPKNVIFTHYPLKKITFSSLNHINFIKNLKKIFETTEEISSP